MDKQEVKYVLVTGGAGYIGSHTVVALIEQGFVPIVLDDLRNAKSDVMPRLEKLTGKQILHYKAACHNEDVLNEIFNSYSIFGVIHFAADKAVGESVEDPVKYFDNNLGGLISLMKAMEKAPQKIQRLVFSSSCTVYGEPKEMPVTENFPVGYSSPYGFTKLVNEQMLEQFQQANKNAKVVLLRYFNPIGAHKSGLIGEEPEGIPSNLLPYITQTAAGIREHLTIYGDDYDTVDGTCIRDYIHVSDLANAHVAALDYLANEKNKSFDVFNVGAGKGTSVKELINAFEKGTGIKIPVKIGARRAGDVEAIFADVLKSKESLNWSAEYSIENAVTSAWNFQQNRLK